MNTINLKRAFNYMLENVKPEEFDMNYYLIDVESRSEVFLPLVHPCNTVGCIIGKCAEIFNKTDLQYFDWSEKFFDLRYGTDAYMFMFNAVWADNPETATLEQALLRMKFVIDHGEEPAEYHYFGFAHVMSVQPLTPYEV